MPTLSGMERFEAHPTTREGYLDGQFLVAMPGMADERFSHAVIYVCAHSAEGAMGIVINQRAPNINFPELLAQLDLMPESNVIHLPEGAEHLSILRGGPVETARGFVLHTADFFIENSTLPIDEDVCLTATVDILKAIADGSGPRAAVLALGYAGWGAGQLESEIQGNGWLQCAADQSIIFDGAPETKYERALRGIGVDPAMLSGRAGHA